jgi:hypothetical protein
MTNDPGARERRPRPDWMLPRLTSVATRLVSFEPPKHRNFDSALEPVTTVEFLVETDAPIPARALAPVLYVGDTPVTEVVAQDDTHYRFTALQPHMLREDDPVTLGWSGGAAADRVDAGIRFTPPDGFPTRESE